MYYNNGTIIYTVWTWCYIYRFSNCFLTLYLLFFTIYKSFYSFEIYWFQSKKTITTCNKDLHKEEWKSVENSVNLNPPFPVVAAVLLTNPVI